MALTMRNCNIRTIARWALVVFVMAWLNLVIQAPLHAAMKQQNHHPCDCSSSLCDLVLSMEEQADDALGAAALDKTAFQVAFITVAAVQSQRPVANIVLRRSWQDVRQYSPPPLLLKTTLLI